MLQRERENLHIFCCFPFCYRPQSAITPTSVPTHTVFTSQKRIQKSQRISTRKRRKKENTTIEEYTISSAPIPNHQQSQGEELSDVQTEVEAEAELLMTDIQEARQEQTRELELPRHSNRTLTQDDYDLYNILSHKEAQLKALVTRKNVQAESTQIQYKRYQEHWTVSEQPLIS